MGNDTFVYTEHMVTVSNQLWEVTSIVGAAVCFLVLIVICVVFLHPVSRPHLDRVSFRIVVWALVANMVFGITNAIGGSFTGPTWACGFTIFLLLVTLELSSFLVFCIALNLQLVVVHHISGQRMEKYYILGSLAISLCVSVPPYIANQYGWDPIVQDCWYSDPNGKKQLRWEIGAQLFWVMLTVAGEVCTSLTVMVYMFRLRRQVRNQEVRTRKNTTGGMSVQASSRDSKSQHSLFADAYRAIIIRIALYPIVSCVVNLTAVASVISSTVEGVQNMNEYRVLLLSDFIYGGRAVIYGLLAATDPSLLRALKALVWHFQGKKLATSTRGHVTLGSQSMHPLSVHIELTTTSAVDRVQADPESLVPKLPSDGPRRSAEALPTWSKHAPGLSENGPDGVGVSWGEHIDRAREAQSRLSFEQQCQEAQEREVAEDSFKRQI